MVKSTFSLLPITHCESIAAVLASLHVAQCFTIEHVGRRPLMIGGFLFMAFCCFGITVSVLFQVQCHLMPRSLLASSHNHLQKPRLCMVGRCRIREQTWAFILFCAKLSKLVWVLTHTSQLANLDSNIFVLNLLLVPHCWSALEAYQQKVVMGIKYICLFSSRFNRWRLILDPGKGFNIYNNKCCPQDMITQIPYLQWRSLIAVKMQYWRGANIQNVLEDVSKFKC